MKTKITLINLFFQVVWMLKEKGYIQLDKLFIDGTKLEANAGRYTYVWRKNIERYKAGVKKKIELLLEEINQINAQEDRDLGNKSSAEKLQKYESQEEKLGKRNSYSKTDVDATFMRTKDNELRPCYNPTYIN